MYPATVGAGAMKDTGWMDVLDIQCAGRPDHDVWHAQSAKTVTRWRARCLGVLSNVSPDTRSCARSRLCVASVVALGLGFAAHHDRKCLERRGKVFLSNQLVLRGVRHGLC